MNFSRQSFSSRATSIGAMMLVAVVLALIGTATPAQATITTFFSAGTACAGPAVANYSTGAKTTISLCVTTTTETACGHSIRLRAASANESGRFQVTNTTLGPNYPVSNRPSFTYPIIITNPAGTVDFGGATAASTPFAAQANQLLATFEVESTSPAVNSTLVISTTADSALGVSTDATCLNNIEPSLAASITLNFVAVTIAITPATIANSVVGTTYNTTLSASGGTAPYAFTVTAGALPTGLSLSAAGVLTGTTTSAGNFNFNVTATDANGATATSTYVVDVTLANQATLNALSTATTLPFNGTATLSANGGSGTGAVTFQSNNANCTIAGTTLTAAGVGTCNINATKAADAAFNSATSVALVITINQASQTPLVAASTLSTLAFGSTATLSTTGGSGTGAISFASNNANCTIAGTTLTAAAVGTCTITATKAADTNFASITSAGIVITVTPAAQAAVTVSSTVTTLSVNGTATLSSGGGSGTGAVTFASSNANCTIAGTTLTAAVVGSCTVTATKAADANFNAATSGGIVININPATQATLTTVTSSNSIAVGGTANLSSTGGSGTGAVSFASNNANCTIAGTTLTAAAVGTCTITATKAADVTFAIAVSAGIDITVSAATQATLTVSSTASTLVFDGTATLSSSGGSGTGAVSFASNNANCTVAGTTLTAAAVGTCTITASKAGDANFALATSAGIVITINRAAQAALVAATALNALIVNGTATLSTTGGSGLGAVSFASNNANCTIAGTTLTAAAAGSCTVTASKAADANFTDATSVGIAITINLGTQSTLSAASSLSTLVFGGTATLSSTGGSGAGSVSFQSNNANCRVTGTTLSATAVGTCSITATKAADAVFAQATSAGLNITINPATQAVLTLSAASTTLTFGSTTSLSAAGGSGTGAVTFASNNANCTIAGTTLTAAAVGSCNVTATKAASANFVAATSAAITITINQAPQVITFIAPASVLTTSSPFTVIASTPAALTVLFTSTTTAICTSGGANGATITLTGTTGTCTIRASQAGNGNFLPALNVDRDISVTNQQPVLIITQSSASLSTSVSNSISYGTPFTLVAQINGNNPAGVVNFTLSTSAGNSIVCRNVGLNGGAASCVVPRSLRPVSGTGNNTYVVTFDGDSRNTGSSAALTIQINPATIVLSVAASPVKPIVGQAIMLTALLGADDPAGAVTFRMDGAALPGCSSVSVAALPVVADAITGVVPDADAGVANCTLLNATVGSKEITVTYPGTSNNRFAEAKLSINVVAEGPKIDYSDMWWAGMAENGWGLSIAQKGKIQFNAFYVYDNNGKPIWTVMPGGSWNSDFTVYTGLIYQPISAPFSNYDVNQFKPGSAVGSATLTFIDANNATLAYVVNGVSGQIRNQKTIQRQPFGVADSQPRIIVNDLWWADTKENGWGINIAQQARTLFMVWYTYGLDGKTTWFTVPGGVWSGTTFTGDIYTTVSSAWLGAVYDATLFKGTKVGTMVVDFEDANKAMMTYTVNGVTQTKVITRQPF